MTALRRLTTLFVVVAAVMSVPRHALAQSQAAAVPPTPPVGAPASSTPMPPAEPQGYAYNAEGRRDPFVSLQGRGRDVMVGSVAVARATGLAGLATSEVTLRGTLQGRGGVIGILQGADMKTYIVRPGEKLMDGTIRSITPDALVILQSVDDPLSLEKQREVRKALRQMEEAK